MHASGLDPTYWLAQTKLCPALLRPDVIARPRLLELLRSAVLSSRLTLVSAPAGYGKTTLLGALPILVPDLPLAWLSLDEEDGDPARFLTALVLALRRPLPDLGATAMSLMVGPPKPGLEPRHVAGALVNELLERAPGGCLLVLDDLHVISEPGVYLALDYLLERMPPRTCMVVATRHDPPLSLARLRARGQLAELRLADVRFTLEEAEELLNRRLGLSIGQSDMERLYALTEGWPAGVRLLAGSLERIGSPAERSYFIAGLAQDRHLLDYLAAEVLSRQDVPVRDFLLETSILPELTPKLCAAVTRRENAAALLNEVDRRGLFVVAGGVGTGPRYHALFAEFLQSRLRAKWPHRLAELHRRAAEASPTPGLALSHYLAGECWDEAAVLVERLGAQMLVEGLAGTVASWIQAIPASARDTHPRLLGLQAVSSLHLGDLVAARAQLEQALAALETARDEEGIGLAVPFLATCALIQGDMAAAGLVVERAMVRPAPPAQRAQLLMTRCWVELSQGAWNQAAADLNEAVTLAEEQASPDVAMVVAHHMRGELMALPGGVAYVERFVRLAGRYAGARVTTLSVVSEELVAGIHLLRGRLEQAIETSERVLGQMEQLGGYPYIGVSAAEVGLQAFICRGDYDSAGRILDLLAERLRSTPTGELSTAYALYMLGKIRLLQGDLEVASRATTELCAIPDRRAGPESAGLRLKLQGLLAMAERRYSVAERFLRDAGEMERDVPLALLHGSARVLLARLAYERNRPEEALAGLAPVLEECQRQEIPMVVLLDGGEAAPVLQLAVRRNVCATYARWLLSLRDSDTKHDAALAPETGEALSPREQEVLALLAAGASNRSIAEKLVIGETTVKSHVTSILRKLNVSSRGQAAARAREMGLFQRAN